MSKSLRIKDSFCIFILSHGRANRVDTYDKLREHGYTGRIYFVIDDEDEEADDYYANFGDDNVLMFSKRAIEATFDLGDNWSADRRTITFARNATFDLARQVGVRYFMMMDDDYTGFYVRPLDKYSPSPRAALDHCIAAMLEYFKAIPALSIAMSQGGEHQGGNVCVVKRKAMNTFLCDVERPFQFVGRMNEDVNTYTSLSRKGALFLTIPPIQVNQRQTQGNPGGSAEFYLSLGTYVKAATTVMYTPSAVRISQMGGTGSIAPRIHHKITWPDCAAQVLNEKYRRAGC